MAIRKMVMPVLLTALAAAAGCGSYGRVPIDADDNVKDTGLESKDLLSTVEIMAADMVALPEIAEAAAPPTIAFLEVENASTEYIDTNLFLEDIRTELLQNARGKFRFLDRAKIEAIMKERNLKRAGEITTSGAKDLLGADLFLTGSIRNILRADGRRETNMMSYRFRLVDAESSLVIWEKDYKAKKQLTKAWYER